MTKPRSIMILAGEISGDMHAAGLVRALRQADPSLTFFGIGGPLMREAGVETYYDVKDLAVMGIVEVLKRIVFFRKVFRHMEREACEKRPDAVILVDYPGFNLRFASSAHAMGLKTIYYICPQVWAWKQGRIPTMVAVLDRLMAIFPFEPKVFEGTSLKVDFVGHPLIDEIREAMHTPMAPLPWDGEPQIGMLPGSRHNEIDRLLPPMLGAARLIEQQFPTASFVIPTPSDEISEHVRRVIARFPNGPSRLQIIRGEARQVFRQSRAALVKSGTATMEAALVGCPAVITYAVAPLTYWIAIRIIKVKVKFAGIANIIANRYICPEVIQFDITPEALARELIPLLTDSPARQTMLNGYAEIRALLGDGGAAQRAAQVVMDELEKPKTAVSRS
ncbi:MAG: lipid-A-disaccharide synthase [bacterium]